jgi:hypothetical protein
METTSEWHVPDALLGDYVSGSLDALRSASLEHHVERCDDCRRRVRLLVDDRLHEQAWAGVRARIEPPELSLVVRAARYLGVDEPTAILLSAAASLRLASLSAAFVALAFAVGAALIGGDSIWPFLLVAPLIPALGVAAAFGGPEEPTELLTVTAPYGRSRLVVVRTLAVVVATVPVACALGLLLPGPAWIAVAWLGPALAVLSLVLAIGGVAGMRTAVPLVALGWSATILYGERALVSPTWAIEASQQAVYATAIIVAVGAIAIRSIRHRMIGDAL